MDRIIVLNRIPAAVTPLGEWLAEVADRVHLVTDASVADSYVGALSEITVVQDYSHWPGMDALLDELCADGGVRRIVHITEEDVLRAASARDRHGITGQTHTEALPYRDKLLMKQAVARAGLRVPAFAAPESAERAVEFAEQHGWPVVIKPRLGYASKDVRVVHDPSRLVEEYGARDPQDVMVEEFVPGQVFHVDGLMSGASIVFSCPSRYVNDCLAFHDSTPLGSAQLDGDDRLAHALDSFAARVAAALPPTAPTPFHLEVIVDDRTGDLVFCEVACRLGGGHMMETLTLRTGTNPARAWVRAQAGLPGPADGAFSLDKNLYGWVLIPPRPGELVAVAEPDLPSFVRHFYVKTAVPRTFGGAANSVDSVLGFVVEGADSAEVVKRIDECVALSRSILTWR
ncbi:ATP-grasp domain-containing protein [Actinomadura pelletieri DSM 43383]|uniref:ATP-grasp domain-containing protein n=1 Tax=Actinomadura pelletieri DSM 43383 TaxID=1120940 RepID=A0A495Q9R7_9ACTN|nr:ATP-grasp domain-containing protein [Actinomadura pelletieri]RKS68239.1 ATP-grasp domain-containing protein [Actinomadura pelletieri DSM 43383]